MRSQITFIELVVLGEQKGWVWLFHWSPVFQKKSGTMENGVRLGAVTVGTPGSQMKVDAPSGMMNLG
jgi:hypothetical protein